MTSETNRTIQKRTNANDVFYTPETAVRSHLALINSHEGDKWFDPFLGQGAYFNAYPTTNKDWCEIAKDRDFFTYHDKVDIICSNPPYSMIDRVLEHSVTLEPRIISYLIGQGNLTTKRIEYMNTQGYGLASLHMLKVWKWFGMSYIVTFEKGKQNVVSFDRTIHR